MKTSITERGFDLIEFKDSYNKECSLQESSMAPLDKIWLGTVGNRMHLDQKQVAELLPYLENFVKTGDLINSGFLVSKEREKMRTAALNNDFKWMENNKSARPEVVVMDILSDQFFFKDSSIETLGVFYCTLDRDLVLPGQFNLLLGNKDNFLNKEIKYSMLDPELDAIFDKNHCMIRYKDNSNSTKSIGISSILLSDIDDSKLVFKISIILSRKSSAGLRMELNSLLLNAKSFNIWLLYPALKA